jgi:PAS domain S-box-containing protein
MPHKLIPRPIIGMAGVVQAFFRRHRKVVTHTLVGLGGVAMVFVVGFELLASRDSQAHPQTRAGQDPWLVRVLTHSSYDWSFDLSRHFRPRLTNSDVVIIYMDEPSYKALGQSFIAPWDRSIHARLLKRLKEEGAKAVVMDIVFTDPIDPAGDKLLADAIRENGHVVLAQDLTTTDLLSDDQFRIPVWQQTPVFPPFETNAARIGLDQLWPDEDFLIRKHRHYIEPGLPPSLSWAAASVAGWSQASDAAAQQAERWIYYYGPPETIPHVSYEAAYAGRTKPGFFRDKIVFIGARPITGSFRQKRDELRNPYSVGRAGKEFVFMPMVEIHATELLNLLRGDWLERLPPAMELGILALTAVLFGFGLLWFRPLAATLLAAAGAAAVVISAQGLFAFEHVWFPWLIIVAAQIPCALLYAIVCRSLEWYAHRRRLEAETRRADARNREQAALIDKAQDAIIVHDLDWQAQYWNPSAERLYGWNFAELQGKNLRTDIFKADDAKLLDGLQSVLRHGEWAGELTQHHRDGRLLTVSSRWTMVRDEAGRPKSVLVINTDMTERKKLEAQFLRTQRMESIGTLAGGIAHDLNNVLSPILMGVELLKMKSPDEYTLKMLGTMSSSAKRGSDMVKQVLAFARGHGGERSVLQISHLIKEMQKIVKETFPKNIDFKADVGDIAPIMGDATQVHQIILNLCVNARDAMPGGGGISVNATNVTLSPEQADKFPGARPIAYVLLAVSDTGMGIPPEIIDKIFEPFFTTKEIGKGTGLGLSTVISIIKSHGGFLDLQTEVGRGTTFNVYLPAAEAAAPPPVAAIPTRELMGKGETIMVVDDEPAVLEFTQSILVHYGYKVVTAIHGADALALYGQYKEKIKVVLMDMLMPVMDGPSAIRALKERHPGLQFVAISGLMQPEKLKEQLGGEEVSFLGKPYAPEKLLQLLRKLIVAGAA